MRTGELSFASQDDSQLSANSDSSSPTSFLYIAYSGENTFGGEIAQ